MIPRHIVAKALRQIADDLLAEGNFPDSEWFCLDENWDINYWTDVYNDQIRYFATIYRVRDGQTDTQLSKRIFDSDMVDMVQPLTVEK